MWILAYARNKVDIESTSMSFAQILVIKWSVKCLANIREEVALYKIQTFKIN